MELMEVSPRIAFHRIHRIDIRIATIIASVSHRVVLYAFTHLTATRRVGPPIYTNNINMIYYITVFHSTFLRE